MLRSLRTPTRLKDLPREEDVMGRERKISHRKMIRMIQDSIAEVFGTIQRPDHVYLFRGGVEMHGVVRLAPTLGNMYLGFSHTTDRRFRTSFYLGWEFADGSSIVVTKTQAPFPERTERFVLMVREVLMDFMEGAARYQKLLEDAEKAQTTFVKVREQLVSLGSASSSYRVPFSRVGKVLRDVNICQASGPIPVQTVLRRVSREITRGSTPKQLESLYQTFLCLSKTE